MTITENPTVLRRWLLAVGVTLGSIAAVGCGGDDDDDAATAGDTSDVADAPADYGDTGGDAGDAGGGSGGGSAVAYTVNAIEYTDVSAPAGGTIEIENTSGAPHTFTADDSSFDVEYGDGETATVAVPDESGEYSFHCNIHPSMQATLTVE